MQMAEVRTPTASPWIFGSIGRDLLWLCAAGYIALFISFFATEDLSISYILYAYLAFAVIDDGHVYMTMWRTYFNPSERKSSKSYLWAPILIAAFFIATPYLDIVKEVIVFVAYLRIFHVVQQFYGIGRWYQRLNGIFRPASDRFFYALCLIPILIGSVRPEPSFQKFQLIHFPSEYYFDILVKVYAVVVIAWFLYEVSLARKKIEWNRILAILCPASLYAIGFLKGQTIFTLVFPLMISHGIAYFGLSYFAMKKIDLPLLKRKLAPWWIVGVPAALGTLSFTMVYVSKQYYVAGTLIASTTFCCHHFFDTFIWRRRHREGARIYS
jgi:hypothetical protein